MGQREGVDVMTKKPSRTASIEEAFQWFKDGVFRIKDGQVYKGDKQLAQRINCRQRMDDGDARVDLCHNARRRSCHVSQLVWMVNADMPVPKGFEIHHLDEDKHNNAFNNLVCVHALDHAKLHGNGGEGADDDVPF